MSKNKQDFKVLLQFLITMCVSEGDVTASSQILAYIIVYIIYN